MKILKLFCNQLCAKARFSIRSQSSRYAGTWSFSHQHHIIFKKSLGRNYQFISMQYCHKDAPSKEGHNPFQDMMHLRRSQARSSVLIEIPSKDDVAYVASLCENIGKVETMLSYTGEHNDIFLLTEFSNEETVGKLLNTCQLKNTTDTYPLCSRLLHFEKKKKKRPLLPVSSVTEILARPENKEQKYTSVSEMMKDIYEMEKLSDLNIRHRFLFSCLTEDAFKGMFPVCAVIPFGSSVNSFGKEGTDLDVMLRLYPEKNNKSEFCFQTKTCVGEIKVLQQRSINCFYEVLRTFFPGITYVQRILHARVPILKFRHKILGLDCDLSINNMTAIYMSELLYFMGELDDRVKPLVFTIKKWARHANITFSQPGAWVTNFSLTLLVFFFLQNRPVPILPPLCKAVNLSACYDNGAMNGVRYLESAEKWKSMASTNDESLETLLGEFFQFIGSFSFEKNIISLMTGEATNVPNGYPLWIQYPLEEDVNVSKNVSMHELNQLSNMAKMTWKNMKVQRTSGDGNFLTFLGMQTLQENSDRIDISSLYSDSEKVKKVHRGVR